MAENQQWDRDERTEETGNMDEQDLFELLDRLENHIVQAKPVPFSNKVWVEPEEMQIIISMLRDNLPVEIKQARWLLEQNRQMTADARREADQIVRQAENRMAAMLDEHEITRQAREYAEQTVERAKGSAEQIRQGAIRYAEERLGEVEDELTEILVQVQKNRAELRES